MSMFLHLDSCFFLEFLHYLLSIFVFLTLACLPFLELYVFVIRVILDPFFLMKRAWVAL